METINSFFADLSSFLWGWPMIILLLGTHIFLTIRLKFPQRKIFVAIKLSVKRDKDSQGDVSQFGALATAMAATIGTGNIIGVATAIALGGPGKRTRLEMACHPIRILYRVCLFRYRQHGTGKCYFNHCIRNLCHLSVYHGSIRQPSCR